MFPAETLGKHYVVTSPSGPAGSLVAHAVRIYGHVDGTVLTYKPNKPGGCPAMIGAGAVAVEQYRQKYVFLAPTDYKTSFVDIVAGTDTRIALDGADITSSLKALNGTAFFVARVQLPATNEGAHSITATRPVSIQVLGYGDNTSFSIPVA